MGFSQVFMVNPYLSLIPLAWAKKFGCAHHPPSMGTLSTSWKFSALRALSLPVSFVIASSSINWEIKGL